MRGGSYSLTDNKRALGSKKEELACAYLTKQGFEIKERNFRCRIGEIDIIGMHEGYLVFVEVKYRANKKMGNALEAVNLYKQKKICQVSDFYRCIHRYGFQVKIRYDVVAIQEREITWLKNAFVHR